VGEYTGGSFGRKDNPAHRDGAAGIRGAAPQLILPHQRAEYGQYDNYCRKGSNHLSVAGRSKRGYGPLQAELPQGFLITIAHDSTEFFRDELRKNIFRTSFSLVLLLLFVFLVTLQRRYLFIVAISLLANIIIAFIFYFILGVEIHLYSLAGITVSLGILIDNTIVMIDHLRHKKTSRYSWRCWLPRSPPLAP
jgi:Cu/Ag efflux pump CusA